MTVELYECLRAKINNHQVIYSTKVHSVFDLYNEAKTRYHLNISAHENLGSTQFRNSNTSQALHFTGVKLGPQDYLRSLKKVLLNYIA